MVSLLVKMASLLRCSTVYGALVTCIRIAERQSKQNFKRDLADALRTSAIFTFGTILPSLRISLFDAIFTEHLWSWRGFFRSCLASVVTVTISIMFWYSSVPDDWHVRISGFPQANHPNVQTWFLVASRSTQGMELGRHGEIIGAVPNASLSLTLVPLHIFVFLPFVYNLVADLAMFHLTFPYTITIVSMVKEIGRARRWRRSNEGHGGRPGSIWPGRLFRPSACGWIGEAVSLPV